MNAESGGFLRFALTFELGLVLVAMLIGWPLGIDPWRAFRPNLEGLAIGSLATAPLVALLLLLDRESIGPMRRIRAILERHLLPHLRGRSALELALLAGAAGIGEEVLFRGLIQGGIADRLGTGPALAISSSAFGLLHALTISYALVAGLIGLYLGALFELTGDLTAPIVAHGLYDFVALLYFLRTGPTDRIRPTEAPPKETSP